MLKNYKFSDKEKTAILSSMVYVIDTREKRNEHIVQKMDDKGIKYIKRKLDYGDYSFYIPKNEDLGIHRDIWFDQEIVIERKASLEELSGNLTTSRARFKEELSLAPKHKVLLIESNCYDDLICGNYMTNYDKKSFLATLHKYWFKYECPFFFVEKKDTLVFIKFFFEGFLKERLR